MQFNRLMKRLVVCPYLNPNEPFIQVEIKLIKHDEKVTGNRKDVTTAVAQVSLKPCPFQHIPRKHEHETPKRASRENGYIHSFTKQLPSLWVAAAIGCSHSCISYYPGLDRGPMESNDEIPSKEIEKKLLNLYLHEGMVDFSFKHIQTLPKMSVPSYVSTENQVSHRLYILQIKMCGLFLKSALWKRYKPFSNGANRPAV